MSLPPTSPQHWSRKFLCAFRGLREGVHGQSSFVVHFVVAAMVVVAAVILQVNLLEWCVLTLCMGLVLTAELFNSALEQGARAITRDYDDEIRNMLDIASGAVLVASIFSAVVGTTIFVFRLGIWMGWWGGYLLI